VTWRRLLPLGLAVTALLAIVALAARGRPLRANGGKNSGLPLAFWDYVFTTAVIVFAAGAIVSLVLYFILGRGEGTHERKSARTARSLAIILAVCVVLAIIGKHIDFHHLFHPHDHQPVTPPGSGRGLKGHHRHVPAPNSGVSFQWPELAVVVGALLVLGLIVATRSRALSPLNWSRDGSAEQLAAALDQSLDDLRAEPDLRRAIVAAYARMETTLAAAGFPRRPAEAPREYLERSLLALDTSAPSVRKLTDLFEWARFSHHEPEPGMRDEAIQSLIDVRDELRGRAPVPA
jgi:hypothetical protein